MKWRASQLKTIRPYGLDWSHGFPASLSLPLREDRYLGAPVEAVFGNLLPDDEGIRRRMAARVGAQGVDADHLLAAMGRDRVGALQFLPEGVAPGPAGAIEGELLSDERIDQLLRDLAARPLGLGADDAFRISLAGAQEKTALLRWEGRWLLPLRATATTHIFKPGIGALSNGVDLSSSVENEFFCLKVTDALGLPTAKAEMLDFGGGKVLVIERFDRLWTEDGRLLRLPQEDFCQALSVPSTLKYEADGGPGLQAILKLLQGSDAPEEDQALVLKAVAAFWLLAATDGHAKNFSLRLFPQGRFRLAPLYDVISAQPSADAGQISRKQMKLAMAIGDRRHYGVDEVMPRHFLQSASKAGVRPALVRRVLGELLSEGERAMTSVQAHLPADFPEEIAASICGGFRRRLRRLEAAKLGEEE